MFKIFINIILFPPLLILIEERAIGIGDILGWVVWVPSLVRQRQEKIFKKTKGKHRGQNTAETFSVDHLLPTKSILLMTKFVFCKRPPLLAG